MNIRKWADEVGLKNKLKNAENLLNANVSVIDDLEEKEGLSYVFGTIGEHYLDKKDVKRAALAYHYAILLTKNPAVSQFIPYFGYPWPKTPEEVEDSLKKKFPKKLAEKPTGKKKK